MPRFKDEWVIDRVLFDFVAGGSCACCGFQHFLPNGTADLIGAVSDLETDQQTAEIAALSDHPWPAELRDQVWADRVRLRQKLKLDKKEYQALWQEEQDDAQAFQDWCGQPSTYQNFRRWFQLPRTELMETIHQKYNIHSAFGVVLCAVVEQVAGFHLTAYPPDGRGEAELDFETQLLTFDRRGGFTMKNIVEEDGVTLNREKLTMWMNQLRNIGSPGKHLLQRKASPSANSNNNNNSKEEDDEGDVDGPITSRAKTSFASDRRIIRLLIARKWAELLFAKFREYQREQQQDAGTKIEEEAGNEVLEAKETKEEATVDAAESAAISSQ